MEHKKTVNRARAQRYRDRQKLLKAQAEAQFARQQAQQPEPEPEPKPKPPQEQEQEQKAPAAAAVPVHVLPAAAPPSNTAINLNPPLPAYRDHLPKVRLPPLAPSTSLNIPPPRLVLVLIVPKMIS